MRKFEVIEKYKNKNINIPKRATKNSAGYDLEAAETVILKPFKLGDSPYFIPTGIKASYNDDEFLMIVNRSSGPKKGLVMTNGIGIIDSDYYNNSDNEGHIFLQFINITNNDIVINKGDRIGQGVFCKYFITSDDTDSNIKRNGGHGSTGN